MKDKTGIILTTGSRTFKDYNLVARQVSIAISDLVDEGYTKILVRHGGNVYRDKPSADGLVVEFVNKIRPSMLARGIDVDHDPVYPDWDAHGRAAGPIRNHKMVDMGFNIGLVFFDGNSRGTTDCMNYMIKKGYEPRVFRSKND